MKPQQAWEAAVGQLQKEMPKAAFETWVRDAQFVSYDEGEFTIGVFNAYARDWLESRLSSTLTRLLTGIMNSSVMVQFIVWEDDETQNQIEDPPTDSELPPLQLQFVGQPLRDALTEPHKVVVIPGYFRHWVPFLGPTLAWIVVAFRQVMFLGTHQKVRPHQAFQTSPQQVARWAGIARNTLWRNLKDHRLRWFLNQPDSGEHVYEFRATMPLTPGDADQLQNFLTQHGVESNPISAIKIALDTPISQILPYPTRSPEDQHLEMEPKPRSVQDVVIDACGHIKAAKFKQVSEMADQLAAHLMPPNEVIMISHYFLLNWVKQLGAAPAWFITLLRDRCYISKEEIRNTMWVHGGDSEIAQMLGLNRPKTISEWLTPLESSRFNRPLQNAQSPTKKDAQKTRTERRETKRNLVKKFIERIDFLDKKQHTAWQFKVNLVEPLIAEDQREYDHALSLVEAFLSTNNLHLLEEILHKDGAYGTNGGAFGTDGGAHGTGSSELAARLEQVAARMEQTQDAFGTGNGAHGTDPGRVWNALSSLNHLRDPMTHLSEHLKTTSSEKATVPSSLTTEPIVTSTHQELVVGDVPERWELEPLLLTSQLYPGTRKKLLDDGVEAWILVSHMLYAHSCEATNANNPMALVGSALANDASRGIGGHFDVLAQLPPITLVNLIAKTYQYAKIYPSSTSSRWKSGNLAWDLTMSPAHPNQLIKLAMRLGITQASPTLSGVIYD